jgi:dipeptidase
MKQDRFLLGILVGIGVLIVVALALFFTRQDNQDYVSDTTPEGVVHNYALALYKDDYDKAYAYLAEDENKPTYNEYRQAFFNHYVDPSNAGLEIGETEIVGEEAYVTVYTIYNPSGPFSSGYRNTETARLERQNGEWKLLQMPYSFWSYEWYQPTPVPIPAPK